MANHEALIPSFRDFSFYGHSSEEPAKLEPELPKPNVLELDQILTDSQSQRTSPIGWRPECPRKQ